MKHLKKAHQAQCMLYAFAMAFDVNPQDIIRHLRHDGTEVIWPDLPPPKCYRGFHIAEMYHFAMMNDYAIYELPREVITGHDDQHTKEVKIHDYLNYARAYKGVLLTENHAYAYDGWNVIDPDTGESHHSLLFSDVPWHTFYVVGKPCKSGPFMNCYDLDKENSK